LLFLVGALFGFGRGRVPVAIAVVWNLVLASVSQGVVRRSSVGLISGRNDQVCACVKIYVEINAPQLRSIRPSFYFINKLFDSTGCYSGNDCGEAIHPCLSSAPSATVRGYDFGFGGLVSILALVSEFGTFRRNG